MDLGYRGFGIKVLGFGDLKFVSRFLDLVFRVCGFWI